MAAVTSPARHAALLATSASNREPRQSKAHRAMEWPKPSSARSSVTMSASVRVRMQRPSCTSYQLGSLTTTRFTRTRHSDIVHPVSSSQLTEARDRVRSFGGYNTSLHCMNDPQPEGSHGKLHRTTTILSDARRGGYMADCGARAADAEAAHHRVPGTKHRIV